MRNTAREKFQFMTSSSLVSVTGTKAGDIRELLEGIRSVSGSSIYHHSHQVFREWQAFDRAPMHDFGYWVGEVLREKSLGERLAAADPTQFDDVRGFRDELTGIIEGHLSVQPLTNRCPAGSEFHFCESTSAIMGTGITADNLKEFIEGLGRVTNRCLYYHLFEARLRLKRPDNDFSIWLREQLGERHLADQISTMDIMVYSLEQIRGRMFVIFGERQGVSPLELVASLVQLPVDMVESVLVEMVNLPMRTADRFWRKNPQVIAKALAKAMKMMKKTGGRDGAGKA